MAYDFHNLTQSQQWLLTVGGWDMHTKTIARPGLSTVRPLVERGLVAVVNGAVFVPTDVHVAWCEHCADLEATAARKRFEQRAQKQRRVHLHGGC